MTVKSCEKVEKSRVVLTIRVDREEFQSAVEKAYRKMRNKISVPGFRPGKAPRKMIESRYGSEVFYEEAINIAFPDAYEAAVKEQELRVVGYPDVEMVDQVNDDGFTVKATVAVYPEVTLGQYKGLSAPKNQVEVSDADVDRRLSQLTERNTRLVSVDREAREGDVAVIDYEGFLDGKPFDGGKGSNHSLDLGSHSFVPGFEEQVVGMRAGDEKDINVTFPKDYHRDLAGKEAVFKVVCHEVKEKDVPSLDDEFAKDVSEFDTLEELKADLRRQIEQERQKAADQAFEDALMEQVAENITADVPDAMVELQTRQYIENFKGQITQQGIPYDQYAKMTGLSEQKILEDAKEPALRQVRLDLALAAVVEAEGIQATDEEVAAEYQKMADRYMLEPDVVKKYFTESQVRDQIITQKAVSVIVDSAVAVKPEKEASDKPEEDAEEPGGGEPVSREEIAQMETASQKGESVE